MKWEVVVSSIDLSIQLSAGLFKFNWKHWRPIISFYKNILIFFSCKKNLFLNVILISLCKYLVLIIQVQWHANVSCSSRRVCMNISNQKSSLHVKRRYLATLTMCFLLVKVDEKRTLNSEMVSKYVRNSFKLKNNATVSILVISYS